MLHDMVHELVDDLLHDMLQKLFYGMSQILEIDTETCSRVDMQFT